MPPSRIHDLSSIGTLTTSDILAVDDASDLAGPTKRITVQQILDLVAGGSLGAFLEAGNNLSDLTDPAAARANLGVSGGVDGAYSAITHSSNGALALDFDTTNVGFVVTASANITDITVTNGPTSGNQKRRTLEVVATASITVAAASLDVVDTAIPASMINGDSFMADVVVNA